MSRSAGSPPLMAAGPLAPAVLLAQLAQHVLDSATEVHPATIAAVVRVCCPHITRKAERMRLWDEYLAAVRQESGILDGLIGWADVDPELTCTDRTAAATDIAVETSRQALEALTGRSAPASISIPVIQTSQGGSS